MAIDDYLKNNLIDTIKNSINIHPFTFKKAIEIKGIYLRLSLIGNCNHKCEFCHNEGATKAGINSINTIKLILEHSNKIGFSKVQFTGGEPLLYPNLEELMEIIKDFPDIDFGITTNGILLEKYLSNLSSSNLKRVHISIIKKRKILVNENPWMQVDSFKESVDCLSYNDKDVYINVPIHFKDLNYVNNLFRFTRNINAAVRIYTIITNSNTINRNEYLNRLKEIINLENCKRKKLKSLNKVSLRGYLIPQGVRCKKCEEKHQCLEKSRSLRFGADGVFRPCLASRNWDVEAKEKDDFLNLLKISTIYALDW